MTESILQEADRIINGQRRADYGPVEESFLDIAARWTVELGSKLSEPLTPFDVVHLMAQLKLSRAKNGYHRDSYVDIAGYAGLAELLQGETLPAPGLATPPEIDSPEEVAGKFELPREWNYPSEVAASAGDGEIIVTDRTGREFTNKHSHAHFILVPVSGEYSIPSGPFTEVLRKSPRSWQQIEDVPLYVKVSGRDGDEWVHSPEDGWQCWLEGEELDTGINDPDNYGPFVEILP